MKRKANLAMVMVLSLLSIVLMYQHHVWSAEPMIAVNGSGAPGSAFEVIGSNFVPGEIIELELVMDDLPILVGKKGQAIVVDDNGSFTGNTNYPHKLVAVPGMWELTATGNKGSQASCKMEIKKP
jgi:hypothetical protein